MSLLNNWIETARGVLTGPGEFFREEERREGFGFPARFAAVSILASSLLSTVSSTVFSALLNPSQFSAISTVQVLLGSLVGGFVFLLVFAGVVHLLVALLGGSEGFKTTFAVFCYSSALYPVSAALGFIPLLGGIVGLLVGLYGVYIQVLGVEEFQRMERSRAAIAVILPILVLGAVFALVALLLAALFFVSVPFSAGP
jgi:hypothetical protein